VSPTLAAMPRSALVAALVVVLSAATLVGCSGDDDSGKEEPKVQPTPITSFEGSSVRPLRQEFCEAVPEEALRSTVGEVRKADGYADGETHQITSRVTDVVHEFGCTWVGRSGDTARAWVFAPRVTVAQARRLVAAAERGPGCRPTDSYDFGTPSAGVLCNVRGGREASYRGLFVDTWLVCSLTDRRRQLPTGKLVERAGLWCVQVAQAAAG
jgi:hypothetical protein